MYSMTEPQRPAQADDQQSQTKEWRPPSWCTGRNCGELRQNLGELCGTPSVSCTLCKFKSRKCRGLGYAGRRTKQVALAKEVKKGLNHILTSGVGGDEQPPISHPGREDDKLLRGVPEKYLPWETITLVSNVKKAFKKFKEGALKSA
ncbi:uncharacterized protein PSANT_04899 [Moesziomyces antarcticus]|uniref:Uncharacterized protein n=2 Tax=Pseudozyma antarctica TaxID=84753 RepID=A0A5C3FUH1_PSEA2|nr:uncharacterized protein PSANT_04899 [Moesziomyces antarcticus]